MLLTEGPMKIKDLSIWFGLKPETLAKAKPKAREKKFQILKGFADFHFEGKKLIIDKVKIPEYSKAYKFIETHYMDEWGKIIDKANYQVDTICYNQKIDTCARVGDTLYCKYPEVRTQIKKETAPILPRERIGGVIILKMTKARREPANTFGLIKKAIL